MNHEITHVLEKDTIDNKRIVSPIISERYQNIYSHVVLNKLTSSISHQFHQ